MHSFSIHLLGLFVLIGSVLNHKVSNKESGSHHKPLYDDNDEVIQLNFTNFYKNTLGQPYASYVEFYNAYCGHCRKFAPVWQKFADDLREWKDIVHIVAVDCSADENNGLCRTYEIMAYPTVKYFSPNSVFDPKKLGIEVEEQEPEDMKDKLVGLLKNETDPPKHWPSLQPLEENNVNNLFIGLPQVQYIFIAYPEEDSNVGLEVALDLHSIKQISIKQVESTIVAMNLGIMENANLYVVNRDFAVDTVITENFNREFIRTAIRQYIHNRFSTLPAEPHNRANATLVIEEPPVTDDPEREKKVKEILKRVQTMKGVVFLADLDHALRTTLFNEISRYSEINGERLVALQRYINVIDRYSPMADNENGFFQELKSYVMASDGLKGEHFEAKIKRLKTKYKPIFTKNHWVGCQSSSPNLRGFTCGLWMLFHYLTVRAAETDLSNDPLEVLQAVHEYVKYFFGCSQCSVHFQTMAKSNDIWGVKTKDDAILWLWEAHNEVNKRLNGDVTEDPLFPKVQYPPTDICHECHRIRRPSNQSGDIEWDKLEVLRFFKRIYGPQNISRYGDDEEMMLPRMPAALRQQRSLSKAFSEIDLRVGILLYVFCIGMMLLAVKMFIRKRGYRKKPYGYDLLTGTA